MSHSTYIHDTVFIHDSDYGGDIVIVRDDVQFSVPMEHLKEFIAGVVKAHRMQRLEELLSDIPSDVLLGLN